MQTLLGRFYSKGEKKTVSVLGWPSGIVDTVTLSVSGGEASYISPVDGWIRIAATSETSPYSQWCGTYTESGAETSMNFPVNSESGVNYTIPVRKGEKITSYFGLLQQLKYYVVQNVANVGGGAKTLFHLLQKGGGQCLCLSSSFKVLSKRLFLWSIQAQTKFPRALQVITKRLSLRLMDLLSSLRVIYLTSTRSTLRTTGYKVLSRRISMRGDALGYHVERDSQSPSRRTDLRFPFSDLLKHNFGKFEFSANEQEVRNVA